MDYDIRSDGRVHHGEPIAMRSDRYGFDDYRFPSGLRVMVYDDGRVKVGAPGNTVAVTALRSYGEPGEVGSDGHVMLQFDGSVATHTPRPGGPKTVTGAELDELTAAEHATTGGK